MTEFARGRARNLVATLVSCLALGTGGCSTKQVGPAPDGSAPGDAAGTWEEVPICDGGDGLRLLGRTLVQGVPFAPLYAEVEGLLGVDGGCRFWVFSKAGEKAPAIRTGTLSRSMEAFVAERLRFGRWNAIAGEWLGKPEGRVHYATRVWSNGHSLITCRDGCDAADVPGDVQAMRDAYSEVTEMLWAVGSPPTGALRIRVHDVRMSSSAQEFSERVFQWPAKIDLASLSIGPADWTTIGMGHALTDPDDVKALRRLHDEFDRLNPGQLGVSVYRTGSRPGFVEFQVWMRDVVPFEDQSGYIPLRW